MEVITPVVARNNDVAPEGIEATDGPTVLNDETRSNDGDVGGIIGPGDNLVLPSDRNHKIGTMGSCTSLASSTTW